MSDWTPAVGDIVRVAIPDTHPAECTGHYGCIHGLTGRVVQINHWGMPNTPYYIIGDPIPWGAGLALKEIEPVPSLGQARRGEGEDRT